MNQWENIPVSSRWEVWTRWEGARTRRHYDGNSEASARQIFAIWKEDMQQAKTVMLLEDGNRVEEYTAPPKPEPVHSPEILIMLQKQSDLFGIDVTSYIVYGSAMRPMSTSWVRIPGCMCIPAQKHQTGYHSYVIVPEVLRNEVITNYELEFVSRPAND